MFEYVPRSSCALLKHCKIWDADAGLSILPECGACAGDVQPCNTKGMITNNRRLDFILFYHVDVVLLVHDNYSKSDRVHVGLSQLISECGILAV